MTKMKTPTIFIPEKNLEKNIELFLSEPMKYKTNNLKIEPVAKRNYFYFDESLERLKKAGYERHLRPWESFDFIVRYFEGKLRGRLEDIAEDMLKGVSEWLSMAVERKGNKLICYINPENLNWDHKSNCYTADKGLDYHDREELDIKGIPSERWVDLEELHDDFIEYFYTKKFESLPKQMLERWKPQIYLPPKDVLWPIGRGCYGNFPFHITGYFHDCMTSRGARIE